MEDDAKVATTVAVSFAIALVLIAVIFGCSSCEKQKYKSGRINAQYEFYWSGPPGSPPDTLIFRH